MSRKEKVKDTRSHVIFLRGAAAALPIVLGYLPVGFAFGVLAQEAGLSLFNTVLMSLMVFAGSAQLIAVGLIAASLSPLSIITTTFIVNLRHLLMSAALFPRISQWRKRELAGFAFELTDETFGLHATRFESQAVEKGEVFAINLTAHTAWIITSGLGALMGRKVSDIESLGLDYALPAMFIALLVMQVRMRTQAWAAILAGALSLGLLMLGFKQSHVILATVIGAILGAGIEGWKTTRSY